MMLCPLDSAICRTHLPGEIYSSYAHQILELSRAGKASRLSPSLDLYYADRTVSTTDGLQVRQLSPEARYLPGAFAELMKRHRPPKSLWRVNPVNWQSLHRFWRRQSTHRQICFGTAIGAVLAAVPFLVTNAWYSCWASGEGLILVGAFYLVLGLIDRNPPTEAVKPRPRIVYRNRLSHLAQTDALWQDAWKRN
jgi:hypothetical protein